MLLQQAQALWRMATRYEKMARNVLAIFSVAAIAL